MNSLFKRTFMLIAASLATLAVVFIYSHISGQQAALIDVMHSKSGTVAKSIALVSSDAMVTEDYSFIVEHTQNVLHDNDEIVYTLVSKRGGDTIFSTGESWNVLPEIPEELQRLQRETNGGSGIVKSRLYGEKVYHLSYPVIFSGIEWGWVAIGLSLKQYDEGMKSVYRDGGLLLTAIFLASILFSFILARWLVGPIVELNVAAKRVTSGDLSARVEIVSTDEVGELAGSFNTMVEALEASDRRLRSYNIELERRVQERTEALKQLNRELDNRVKSESLKRTEQERMLIQQSRFAAMGEMIGNIAHQWRQPLNALGLLLQNIETAYEMDMLDKEFIERSVEKGRRLTVTMSQTIDDFRNFFKPNKTRETFRISEAFDTTLDIMRSSLDNNAIVLETEIDGTLCTSGFPSEFSQVLLNILNNAKDVLIERRRDSRRIFVRVGEEGDNVRIEIGDNAGGIPPGIIDKIFDPYFTTKEEGKGTGIGLYMSKTIIENNMNGSLGVENSEAGARFFIRVKKIPCKDGING